MEVVLFLMNQKGKDALESICGVFDKDLSISVICSRDKYVHYDAYDDIKAICKKYSVPFYDRNANFKLTNRALKVAIGWRWLIDDATSLIVFHDSLLPKYRGFAPLVNSLINGEESIGVTAFFASGGMDEGDIIDQESTSIEYPITIRDAIAKISPLYSKILIKVINSYINDSLNSVKQKQSEATYSVWRNDDDYKIDWNNSADEILRFINAVGFPYLGAFCFLNNMKVLILEAEIYPSVKLELCHVGKVLFIDEGNPVVITGKGLLKLNVVMDLSGNNMLPLSKLRVCFK